ncbi:MFS general substrate transporter [Poronia punctata]|nr:MFS general substrate transporter [Poronia punctata]
MTSDLEQFLKPLHIDVGKAHRLAHELFHTFRVLAAESPTQFLPTPISESILRPTRGSEKGRGGTNLRVGFVELMGSENAVTNNGTHVEPQMSSNIRLALEKSWPIQEHLKNENSDSLFSWIGSCIAQVVREGVDVLGLDRNTELPMGVTFSFPVVQESLSNATIMAMGKGFAITSHLDLGSLLVNGYDKSRTPDIPQVKVTAILNDAVATLVSFIYQYQEDHNRKAAMSLICGTGTNATIPLRQSRLNPTKLPSKIAIGAEDDAEDVKVAVNTEWSINGSAPPLRKLGLISKWDTRLDEEGEVPGFQPLEYMTAGRYLGELARLMFVDYLETHLAISKEEMPVQLLHRFGLTTTFLSHYQAPDSSTLVRMLEGEFPAATAQQPIRWTKESATALFYIAKSIEVRASGLVAAAIVGLLACADDIPLSQSLQSRVQERANNGSSKMNLVVGFTGGCIVHFQDYLSHCQSFLDSIVEAEFGEQAPIGVVLSPCHDGGITGAGVLCGAAQTESREPGRVVNAGDREHNEHTPLLRPEQRAGDETNTDESETERDSLLAHNPSWTCETPASLVPGPLKPMPPEPISDDERDNADLEANHRSPASGASGDGNGSCDHDGEPASFLIDTHPRQFRITFAGIMLTYFIANFDGTIMASSHPAITSYFNASNKASWLTTSFLLTSTAFQPLVGRLSDTVGRKPLYLTTMCIFAAATAWCALAQSMTSFIAARAVCGLGAGGMMTLGAISISDCMPIERRGPYQSCINIVYGVAAASGAAFGGIMADTLGWRWEFGIQLFPLALCLITAYFSMPDDLGLQSGRGQTLMQALRGFDIKGSVLLTTSVTFLILGLNLGGNVLPWSHPLIISSLVVFGVCFPACLYVESRAERPIMPLALLHSTPRANIIFSNALASFLVNAILFNSPLFFQAVLLKSATQSGLYLLVPVGVSSVVGALTGILISRTKRLKWPLLSGTACYVVGGVLLSVMSRGWPTWVYLVCLAPAAFGQGFQFPGTFLAVLAASSRSEQAVVTSTLQLWRALGSVLGVACSSLVFQNALLHYLIAYVSVPADAGGEEWKREFVERVRSSIKAIAELPDGMAKDQVIMSYEAACRATFLVCLGVGVVSLLLILPIRLPRLGSK